MATLSFFMRLELNPNFPHHWIRLYIFLFKKFLVTICLGNGELYILLIQQKIGLGFLICICLDYGGDREPSLSIKGLTIRFV